MISDDSDDSARKRARRDDSNEEDDDEFLFLQFVGHNITSLKSQSNNLNLLVVGSVGVMADTLDLLPRGIDYHLPVERAISIASALNELNRTSMQATSKNCVLIE